MIALIIWLVILFTWLLYETDFMRVRLLVGIEPKPESQEQSILIQSLTVYYLKHLTKEARRQEVEIEPNIKGKVKALRIGYGVYNAKLISDLVNLMPEDKITLKSYPSKPTYKEYTGDGSYIPHNPEPAILEYINHRESWRLLSGYKVNLYSYCEWSKRIKTCYSSDRRELINEWPNDKDLLAVELPIFNK